MDRTVSYFIDKDIFSNKKIKYAKVILHDEPMTINGVHFKMTNVYNVPAKNVNDTNLYAQPIHNPNYNVNRAFKIYRKKMGLLTPQQIKKARKSYGLSQRDVSAILGIPYSTLSRIEDNKMVQSVSQDTSLRVLLDKKALSRLISIRLIAIKIQKPKRVKISKLTSIAKRIVA